MQDIDFVNLLTTYQGRINRAKFWIAVGVFFAIGIALMIVTWILAILGSVGIFLGLIFYFAVSIAMAIAGIFVGIKRLHDRDKSGWWLALFYIGPAVFNFLGLYLGVLTFLFSIASLALIIWAFVELGCLKGTTGPNQYGPDPLTT